MPLLAPFTLLRTAQNVPEVAVFRHFFVVYVSHRKRLDTITYHEVDGIFDGMGKGG
jgi:hypothetical protein